jgi:SSS family solute:Na+ symporter
VCFIFGILWPRINGEGALTSLLVGFVLGAGRFIMEVLDKTAHYQSGFVRELVDVNFLHYSIFMFVVCTAVLIAVSMMFPAPERKKLAGLTFATVDDKIETVTVNAPHLTRETPRERKMNIAFSLLLIATITVLWIHFR